MVAEIGHAFRTELENIFGSEAVRALPSGGLLQDLSQAYSTGHAGSGTRAAVAAVPNLTAQLPVSKLDIGLSFLHPCILPSSYLKTMATEGKLTNLTGGQPLSCLKSFWHKLQPLRPNHPLFTLLEEDWQWAVPIYLIGDEGRGFKKSGILILGWEPLLGFGCEAEDELVENEPLKLNFRGSTYKTRQLYTVVPKIRYSKNPNALDQLVLHWSRDLQSCFSGLEVLYEGATIRLRAVVMGLKADWPALSKLGSLNRHFLREAYPFGAGICHRCMANTEACQSWHEHDIQRAPWVASMAAATLPWKPDAESSLTRHIPMEVDFKPSFYHIDIFHTCHKGVHADLAGGALVFLQHYRIFLYVVCSMFVVELVCKAQAFPYHA